MKKLSIIFLAFPLLFSSCNKKLKNDLNDLEKSVQEQKDLNAGLQNQVNNVNSLLGSNEPMIAITTFKDDNNVDRSVSNTYSFKAGNYSTQYMEDNGDGTYDVYIERFSDVEWHEGASIGFTYDPVTKAITAPYIQHYWDWNISGYNDRAYYNIYSLPLPTMTITINSIDISSGYIDLTAVAQAVDGYNNTVPNSATACTTSLAFKGKLAVMNETF